MKQVLQIPFIAPFFILMSCNNSPEKDVVGCGEELVSGNSANTLSDFINGDFTGAVSTKTHSITYAGAETYYTMIVQINDVCATDELIIDITNLETNIDSSFNTVAWFTVNAGPDEDISVNESFGVHLGDITRTLNESGPSTIIIKNMIILPTTFSTAGDSLRYDSWVDKQSLSVTFHEPK